MLDIAAWDFCVVPTDGLEPESRRSKIAISGPSEDDRNQVQIRRTKERRRSSSCRETGGMRPLPENPRA